MDSDKDIKTEAVAKTPEDHDPKELKSQTPVENGEKSQTVKQPKEETSLKESPTEVKEVKTEEAAPAESKEPTTVVPTMDPNAPLKIEQIKKSDLEVPQSDLKAALKVEDVKSVEEEPQERSSKKLFIMGGIILGVMILATVGFFVFSSREEPQEEKTVTLQPEVSIKPTEVPKKTLNRSEWSLEVLNGSGVSGAAKKVADKLQKLGYKVIKTGNASRSDYKVTELTILKDKQAEEALLLEDLKEQLDIASSSGELKDSTASARIVLGKQSVE